jgi:rod shape-determining protein MreC
MAIVRARPFAVLILLLMLSMGLIVVHQMGYLAPTERFVVQFLTPLQQGVSRVVHGVGSLRLGLADMQRLRRENEQLKTENESLRSLVMGLSEAADENRILRDQLGFSQSSPGFDLLPAQVIGRDPDNFAQTVTIDKGTRDGVREGKVIVAAGKVSLPAAAGATQPDQEQLVIQGLVGKVVEAGPNYARVLLITDLSSGANVVVQGTQAEGLLEGQGHSNLVLKYVRQGESLQPGQVLLTSGLGGAYPRSLAVGIVSSVQTKDQAPFQTATVAPLVDMSKLGYVFVIRSFDPIKVGD